MALTVDETVIIHIDGAGHDWFVDNTPYQDSELMPQNRDTELVANEASDAYGGMDLPTTVMHEMGHVFGYGDVDQKTNPNDLMATMLDAGVRRLPEGTAHGQVNDNADSLIALDMTPDKFLPRIT